MDHEIEAAAPRAAATDALAGAPDGDASGNPDATPRPRRRRRGGRGRGRSGGASRGGQTESTGSAGDARSASSVVGGGETTPDGGGDTNADGARSEPSERANGVAPGSEPGTGSQTSGAPNRRRRRGGRGRGGQRPSTGDQAPAAGEGAANDVANDAGVEPSDDGGPETAEQLQRDDATPDAAETRPRSSRNRNRSRNRRRPSGDPSAAVAGEGDPEADGSVSMPERAAVTAKRSVEEQIAAGGPTRIRSTRTRTGRVEGSGRRRRELIAPPPRVTDKLMVITEHGDRDQIAVLEENVLVQHYVTRTGAKSMVGNVYMGRVQNVLPGMEAAFVDVGRGRNGVLYAGEVNYTPEDLDGPAPRIEQILKPGQSVLVQVTKDPMGGKGARLTANLSLAGRYLVLAPNQNLSGISRRLGEDARRTLKSVLKKVKPPEHGVIVRTAAEGASEESIEGDLRRLLAIWDGIQKRSKKVKAPTVMYEEPELTVRVVRDLFTDEEFRGLVTDAPRVYENVMEYVREVAPDLADKITLHTGNLPAFEEHRIVEQIHKALDKKVWLPSGGYLFIERTEAMTIIDVNTGKSVGKTNLEETVVNTNLEAAREVARQLRLRDIGGIIVVDFIDMLLDKNKKQVEDTMREALAIDKTRSQVFEIGPLGLMQVTRKRVSSGLVESFSETCPTCEGRGIILNYDVS